MARHVISALHWAHLAAILRGKPEQCVRSSEEMDQAFIDDVWARHPGLDRSQVVVELVGGVAAADRWLQVVILRGVQIRVASAGFDVLLLGGLEAPFLAVHRDLTPLAVRTIPPDVELLFAPTLTDDECQAIAKAMDEGVSVTLSTVQEVAACAPMLGYVFAKRVWDACRGKKVRPPRSQEFEERAGEYVALFRGRSLLQQLEMVLSLSERVLTGKRDKPYDRQIQAAAADQMWRELGSIDWAQVDPVAATRGGWLRVASLIIQEPSERLVFVELAKDAMARICQDDPVDVKVATGSTVRVYRFHAGQRTLIDRLGGRRGRVH